MARGNELGSDVFYATANRVVESALRADGSLFTPTVAIWNAGNVEELRRRFADNPDESNDRFEHKLRRQLAGADPEVVQLAGEIAYVYLLTNLRYMRQFYLGIPIHHAPRDESESTRKLNPPRSELRGLQTVTTGGKSDELDHHA
jgi:hypothetical protein